MNPSVIQTFLDEVAVPAYAFVARGEMKRRVLQQLEILSGELAVNPYTKEAYLFLISIARQIQIYDYNSLPWKDLVLYFTIVIFVWELFLE